MRDRLLGGPSDTMSYELIAIGWVPNIDENITSHENISQMLTGSPKRKGFQFIQNGRHVIVRNDLGNYPCIMIQLMDDTGLCHIYIDKGVHQDQSARNDDIDDSLKVILINVWMTFRRLLDNTTEPGYTQSDDGSYFTKIARFAVCSAMNTPIFVSELNDVGKWADAIIERFARCNDDTLDLLRIYPMKYRYWSNPDRLWNRRKVINRAMNLFTMASTDSDCCRSFVSIYSDKITVPRIETKLNIRERRLQTISKYVEGHVESTNLGWLLASIVVALAIGISSLVSGIWPGM